MKARNTFSVVTLALVLVGAAAVAQQPTPVPIPGVTYVSPEQAQALIQKNRDTVEFVVLDVRTPTEFTAGHLAGAVNVDFKAADFEAQASKLDRGKSYLVYCRTGHRSRLSLPILQRLGFARLQNLDGGITAWQRDGFPVTAPPTPAP